MRGLLVTLFLLGARLAHADDACDHEVAVASARSAVLSAPRLFGVIGYVKQPGVDVTDPVDTAGPRVTAGIAYRLDGILAGSATRGRARAACTRLAALTNVTSAPAYRAVEARVQILDGALGEADAILRSAQADVAQRLTTEQELVATRLRVDELRRAAADAYRQLAALPAPRGTAKLDAFYAADAELERNEARLRTLDAFDVTLRAGYDRYLDRDDDSPVFATLSVSINTGVLISSGANDRAAAARRRMVRTEVATAIGQLGAQVAADTLRIAQSSALIADLEAQMTALAKLGGDDGRRYRQTLWFQLVELRAEQAFATAHLAALHEVLGR